MSSVAGKQSQGRKERNSIPGRGTENLQPRSCNVRTGEHLCSAICRQGSLRTWVAEGRIHILPASSLIDTLHAAPHLVPTVASVVGMNPHVQSWKLTVARELPTP